MLKRFFCFQTFNVHSQAVNLALKKSDGYGADTDLDLLLIISGFHSKTRILKFREGFLLFPIRAIRKKKFVLGYY